MNSSLAYHLGELRIATSPDDPRRMNPTLPAHFSTILDLGCGIGQTLIACGLKQHVFACGVDIDEEALQTGKRISPQFHFVRAHGEQMPLADNSFDVVISRVSLPYLNIPVSISEVARVIKPGGQVWFTLHSWSSAREAAVNAIRSGKIGNVVYRHYVMANGLFFHLTGKQFRFPLNRNRCESFQTIASITRALQQAGFEQVRAVQSRFFVVTGVKSS